MGTRYANLLSRLVARSVFESQWVLPVPPPRLLVKSLEWYERHRMQIDLAGVVIDRPIFILSLPRSGSSMLQDILCAHPQVGYITNMMYHFPSCFCAAERFRRQAAINVRGERFLGDSVMVECGSPADPVATWHEWLKLDYGSLAYTERSVSGFCREELDRIREGIRKVLWCFEGRAARFECKTPALLPYCAVLGELFPGGRFIHLVRDPRQNANSMLKLMRLTEEQRLRIRPRHGRRMALDQPVIPYPRLPRLKDYVEAYGPEDIRTTAHLWDDAARFMAERRRRLPSFYEVRYEDIVARPREAIDALLDFCQLPAPDAGARDFWDQVGQVGHLRHTNVYGQFDVVESICRDTMNRHGYH